MFLKNCVEFLYMRGLWQYSLPCKAKTALFYFLHSSSNLSLFWYFLARVSYHLLFHFLWNRKLPNFRSIAHHTWTNDKLFRRVMLYFHHCMQPMASSHVRLLFLWIRESGQCYMTGSVKSLCDVCWVGSMQGCIRGGGTASLMVKWLQIFIGLCYTGDLQPVLSYSVTFKKDDY